MLWQWKAFSELSTNELFEIYKLRQQVFIVEQHCIYQDIDDSDKTAIHLLAWRESDSPMSPLCAYLRVIPNKANHDYVSIGRVIVAETARGLGLGKSLIDRAIIMISEKFPASSIKISAQAYLSEFYESFGFKAISEPYDEDGILHIEMIKTNQ